MTKEEFVAKLQMVYVGDRNAFNELESAYSDLKQRIDKAIEFLNDIKKEYLTQMVMLNPDELLSILQDEKVK